MDSSNQSKPEHAHAPPSSHRPCILVVDDTPANLDILVGLLREDYQLKVATHGEKALKICETPGLVDLILLDVMMPGIDGFEVCRRLRQQPHTRDIPVLFITAKSETDDVVRGFEAGGNDYLSKPFRPAELLARVRTHLLVRSQQLEIARKNTELREMIHILCHDVANHFTVMQMSLELAAMRPDMAVKSYLPPMRIAVKNGIKLTDLVREMRRSEDTQLRLKPTSLTLAVEEALLLIDGKLQAKGLSVRKELPEVNVLAEPTALINSVIGNVLTNAVKFSRTGGVIDVQAGVVGGAVFLSIRDHGIGMPDAVLTHLFDVGKSHSRVGTAGEKGTGFGMPLMHRFVTQFGGRIEVTTRDAERFPEDSGTEFKIWLSPA